MLVAFVGSIAVMVFFNTSFNMISLFGFILALGIVVDDSIVVGEAVYVRRQSGQSGMMAAILGLKEVSTPVLFSCFTTIIAFIPLLFLPGMLGKTYRDLPVIVIIILMISIFEAMMIMPAHLSGMSQHPQGFLKWIRVLQLTKSKNTFSKKPRASSKSAGAIRSSAFTAPFRVVARRRFAPI